MNIPAELLPDTWLWAGGVTWILLLLLALATAPWAKIRDSEAQHVYLGATVALCLLWALRGGVQPGLDIHLLGITLLCLMFEWQFALIAASAVTATTSALAGIGFASLGINVLLSGALPILFSRLFLYLCQRRLPHNYFIYVFVNAFLAGALSILLVGLASAGLQHLAGSQAPRHLSEFVMILPLLMFGEGFINGGTLALAVAYRPQWVATFHDSWYLRD